MSAPDRRGFESGRLWSLRDIMRQFSVAKLLMFASMGGLARARIAFEKGYPPSPQTDKIGEYSLALHVQSYSALEQDCTELELTASRATIRKIKEFFARPDPLLSELHILEAELQGRMVDETQEKIFWALNVRESELYLSPRKGWDAIVARFPDSLADIEEASRCLALSRYAAAVFHSVQVVESGLIELGTFIGVEDPKSGWTAVTIQLGKVMKKDHGQRSDFEKANFEFLEQVQGTVEGLKNAWRNKISHTQGRLALLSAEFTPDIAEEILFASRAFMRRLAEGLPTLPEG